jgi:hypothetical protein
VRQGASWTAAYHRQLTVPAVARPVPSSVVPSASLLPSGPGGCSPRRRLPAAASSRYRAVGRGRRGRPGQQAHHGVGRRCPAGGVHPSGFGRPGSGRPAVRCPVTWGRRRPEGPAVGCLLSTRPASTRPLSIPCGVQPCGVQPSVRTRPSPPMLRRWRCDQVEVPGDRDHRNGWRPRRMAGRVAAAVGAGEHRRGVRAGEAVTHAVGSRAALVAVGRTDDRMPAPLSTRPVATRARTRTAPATIPSTFVPLAGRRRDPRVMPGSLDGRAPAWGVQAAVRQRFAAHRPRGGRPAQAGGRRAQVGELAVDAGPGSNVPGRWRVL